LKTSVAVHFALDCTKHFVHDLNIVIDLQTLAKRLDDLEREQAHTRAALVSAEQARDEYHRLYLEMLERCRKLERGLLGQKAERFASHEAQLSLDLLGMLLSERESADVLGSIPSDEQQVQAHTRHKPTGRNPIAEHIPRVDIEIVPDEVKRAGLDAFERIGEEVTEVLERRPASLVVARILKPKFKRKQSNGDHKPEIYVAATPELPIPRGLAGPGLLADTLVRRWQDHLPLNRLEGIYACDGIELARSTIGGWHEQLAPLAQPLIESMRQDAFEQPYLCVDATGVLVQAKDRCRTGHFWVLVAPGRHVLFEFTRNHDSSAVDDVLAGYEGYLVADAHVVYDHLYADGHITEVNCWAHCRRYYFKALASDPDRAKFALSHIGALFRLERTLANAPRKKRERLRQKHAKPVVERFFSWCDEQAPHVLDDTPIAAGIRYARNQRVGLSRFLEDGRLPIHNNLSELNLRRQAVGRKNWLFVGSDDGGRVNATFTTLLASCRMLGVEPWSYLRDLLCLLPRWPAHRVLELAPLHWPATSSRDDVKASLAENPYRTLTLIG
jgi:transposase